MASDWLSGFVRSRHHPCRDHRALTDIARYVYLLRITRNPDRPFLDENPRPTATTHYLLMPLNVSLGRSNKPIPSHNPPRAALLAAPPPRPEGASADALLSAVAFAHALQSLLNIRCGFLRPAPRKSATRAVGHHPRGAGNSTFFLSRRIRQYLQAIGGSPRTFVCDHGWDYG